MYSIKFTEKCNECNVRAGVINVNSDEMNLHFKMNKTQW